MNIEIVGFGWVGQAMAQLFGPKHKLRITDPILDVAANQFEGDPDVAFICVPTPNRIGGDLDGTIVAEAIFATKAKLIVIRSTVMPGFTKRMQNMMGDRLIVFQPEYLGETSAHPMTDQKGREFAIIGGTDLSLRKYVELLTTVYNASLRIRQVDSTTAEVIKLSENRAIAYKVAQCQELYDACEAAGVNYYEVQQAVYGDDPRMNLWWTFIYPEARGFNSKCIPKDVYGWCSWAESVGIAPTLTKKMLEVNHEYIKDRL